MILCDVLKFTEACFLLFFFSFIISFIYQQMWNEKNEAPPTFLNWQQLFTVPHYACITKIFLENIIEKVLINEVLEVLKMLPELFSKVHKNKINLLTENAYCAPSPPFCWRVNLLSNFGVGGKEEGDLFKGGGGL